MVQFARQDQIDRRLGLGFSTPKTVQNMSRFIYYVYGPITEETRAFVAARHPDDEVIIEQAGARDVVKFATDGTVGLVDINDVPLDDSQTRTLDAKKPPPS